MNCAVCHWPMNPKLQWVTSGYGCALWHCADCNCDIAAKAPLDKFANGFQPSVSNPDELSDSDCQNILDLLRSILSDARPSALRTQLSEVLNDG